MIAKNTLRYSSVFFILVGFLFDVPIVFFISVGFFCIALGKIGKVVGWFIRRPPFSPLYISPFVFPMYMYNPDNSSMTVENEVGMAAYTTIGTFMLWGIFCIVFINPLGMGIMITCLSLLSFVVLTMVREIYIYDTCWWYSLCNFQYRQQYEKTCSYNVDC
jgi:hypothetical protein